MQTSLDRIEGKLDELLNDQRTKRTAAAVRRQQYRESREMREKGKIRLPDFHILKRRDGRIAGYVQPWAEKGMVYGAANDPEGFVAWVVYQWNSCTYLKKPITFSGSYYRVFTGSVRCNYGPYDLMHLNNKQMLKIRHDADKQDFSERPWWCWAHNVLNPVFKQMQEQAGFKELPERFVRCLKLVLGASAELEVYTEVYWSQYESIADTNRMLRKFGPDLRLMWKACCRGLRSKQEPVSSRRRPRAAPAAAAP